MYLSNKLNTVCYESGKGIVKFNKLKKYCKYFLIKMISLECSRKTFTWPYYGIPGIISFIFSDTFTGRGNYTYNGIIYKSYLSEIKYH